MLARLRALALLMAAAASCLALGGGPALAGGNISSQNIHLRCPSVTATTYPMQYLIMVPGGTPPASGWPLLVVITDATRKFMVTFDEFSTALGRDKVAVVVPLTLGSGGQAQRVKEAFPYDAATWARVDKDGTCTFDDEGIAAVLQDVRAKYHTQARATLTGLEAAFSRDPSRAKLPIVVLHGERDTLWTTLGIARQGDAAHAAARAHGFGNWQDRTVPGRAHEYMPDVVFAAMRSDSVR